MSRTKSHSRDWIIGLFTLVAVFLLSVFTVTLTNWDLFTNRRTYYVNFKEAKRLELGAPVHLHGVQVGTVNNIKYVGGEYSVRVTTRIDGSVDLYENATFEVVPAGVIGVTTININPGTRTAAAEPMPPGSYFQGVALPKLDMLAGEITEDIRNTVDIVNTIMSDPEVQSSIKRTIIDSAYVMENLKTTTAILNEDLPPALREFRIVAKQLQEVLTQSARVMETAERELAPTAQSLRATAAAWEASGEAILEEIRKLNGELVALTGHVDSLIEQQGPVLNSALTELDKAAGAMNRLLGSIESGTGTLGKLVTDPTPFIQLREMLGGLNQRLTGRQPSLLPLDPDRPAPAPTPTPAGTPVGGESRP